MIAYNLGTRFLAPIKAGTMTQMLCAMPARHAPRIDETIALIVAERVARYVTVAALDRPVILREADGSASVMVMGYETDCDEFAADCGFADADELGDWLGRVADLDAGGRGKEFLLVRWAADDAKEEATPCQ